MTSPPQNTQIVEHIVLFNVKDDNNYHHVQEEEEEEEEEDDEEEEDYPTKVNAMVNALNALNSLDSVLYLTAGPILRTRSKPASLKFTHMLHARYLTVSDLYDYAVHPDHVSVVDSMVRPLCQDVLSVDWAADVGPCTTLVPRPGSAMRVTLLQVEDEGEKESFFEGLRKVKGNSNVVGPYEQVSYGNNFSDRGKGFTVATLVVFPDLNELDACEEYEDHLRSLIGKIKCNHDQILAVDYLIPRVAAVSTTVE